MLFRDAHVVEAIREFLREARQSGPLTHRGSDGDDPAILTRQPAQGVGGDGGVGRLRSLLQGTACLPVERGTGVQPYRVLHRRFVDETLLSYGMQPRRPIFYAAVMIDAQVILDALSMDRPYL